MSGGKTWTHYRKFRSSWNVDLEIDGGSATGRQVEKWREIEKNVKNDTKKKYELAWTLHRKKVPATCVMEATIDSEERKCSNWQIILNTEEGITSQKMRGRRVQTRDRLWKDLVHQAIIEYSDEVWLKTLRKLAEWVFVRYSSLRVVYFDLKHSLPFSSVVFLCLLYAGAYWIACIMQCVCLGVINCSIFRAARFHFRPHKPV